MDRREFFKKSLLTGVAAGAAMTLGDYEKLFAGNVPPPGKPGSFDLVAVKDGEPVAMFDKAIESFGGMKAFVKKGQTIVVKPNIGWDTSPERGANTNPDLVKRIIEQCFGAGAKTVYVFDNTCDNWSKCYENSGIQKAVKDAGGKIVPANTEGNYQEVDVKDGKRLKKTKVHELILSSDVFINVPVLKSHSSSSITASMKNHMGIVWDRGYWHRNNLNQCIADFAAYRKPDLNIVDAYRVLSKRGPRGVSVEDVVMMKSLVLSRDIVAADAAAAKIFGIEPDTVPYIKLAHEAGVGNMDLTKLSINRIKM
ncbi:MAG: DUF362 domain-containing protein [Bacteroidetes bacterium]|nr:DUF362 domain-containing protein [Bacteroidota bacterium]